MTGYCLVFRFFRRSRRKTMIRFQSETWAQFPPIRGRSAGSVPRKRLVIEPKWELKLSNSSSVVWLSPFSETRKNPVRKKWPCEILGVTSTPTFACSSPQGLTRPLFSCNRTFASRVTDKTKVYVVGAPMVFDVEVIGGLGTSLWRWSR